jgi:hypothetical protein
MVTVSKGKVHNDGYGAPMKASSDPMLDERANMESKVDGTGGTIIMKVSH